MDGDNLNLPSLDITSSSSTPRVPYTKTPVRQDSFGEWSHSVQKTTQSCVNEDARSDSDNSKGITKMFFLQIADICTGKSLIGLQAPFHLDEPYPHPDSVACPHEHNV
eukprot:611412-Hanusia_phi.AAC.2